MNETHLPKNFKLVKCVTNEIRRAVTSKYSDWFKVVQSQANSENYSRKQLNKIQRYTWRVSLCDLFICFEKFILCRSGEKQNLIIHKRNIHKLSQTVIFISNGHGEKQHWYRPPFKMWSNMLCLLSSIFVLKKNLIVITKFVKHIEWKAL